MTRPTVLHRERSMSTDDTAGVESTGTMTAESPSEITAIDWDGPFCERNASGDRTGYTYVQCPDCAIEVLTAQRDHATHRPECGHR